MKSMKSNVKARLSIAVLTLIMLAVCPAVSSGQSSRPQPLDCDVHTGPCSATLMGTRVNLDIRPKPVKAMQDLTFTVTLTGKRPVVHPYIDLGMAGMEMGTNRVILRPVAASVFQGEGVIVRCPSGRRTWKATVTVPSIGAVEFAFDVIY